MGLSWWITPKIRLYFVLIVVVTIALTSSMDPRFLPGVQKVSIIMIAIIFYFVLFTIIEIIKRKIT
jgi:hypothetical protein